MRGKDDTANAHLHLSPQHLQRLLHRLGPVVHSRQDVAMHVSIIEEFNLLLLTSKEFAKHTYPYLFIIELTCKNNHFFFAKEIT